MPNKETKLIDDSGLHVDNHYKKITLFVFLCRFFTVLLIILGIGALIKGFF